MTAASLFALISAASGHAGAAAVTAASGAPNPSGLAEDATRPEDRGRRADVPRLVSPGAIDLAVQAAAGQEAGAEEASSNPVERVLFRYRPAGGWDRDRLAGVIGRVGAGTGKNDGPGKTVFVAAAGLAPANDADRDGSMVVSASGTSTATVTVAVARPGTIGAFTSSFGTRRAAAITEDTAPPVLASWAAFAGPRGAQPGSSNVLTMRILPTASVRSDHAALAKTFSLTVYHFMRDVVLDPDGGPAHLARTPIDTFRVGREGASPESVTTVTLPMKFRFVPRSDAGKNPLALPLN